MREESVDDLVRRSDNIRKLLEDSTGQYIILAHDMGQRVDIVQVEPDDVKHLRLVRESLDTLQGTLERLCNIRNSAGRMLEQIESSPVILQYNSARFGDLTAGSRVGHELQESQRSHLKATVREIGELLKNMSQDSYTIRKLEIKAPLLDHGHIQSHYSR